MDSSNRAGCTVRGGAESGSIARGEREEKPLTLEARPLWGPLESGGELALPGRLLGTGGPGCSRVRRWGDSHQETSCREGNLNRRREAGATQRFRRGCVGETRNPVGPTPSIPPPRPAAATRLCWLARRCDGYTGTLGLREPRSVEVGPGPSELSPVGPVSVSAPQCLRTGAFFPQPSGSRAPVIFGYTLETHLGK